MPSSLTIADPGPHRIPEQAKITYTNDEPRPNLDAAVGRNHIAALVADDFLWSAGSGRAGELGIGKGSSTWCKRKG